MFRSGKQKIVTGIVFGIYCALLIWLVLFKFSTSFCQLPSLRRINLIPFYYDQQTNTHLSEVLYNILVFVPLGVYLQIYRPNGKMLFKCLAVLLTGLTFEIIQFVFAIGASDITDLLGNTLGGCLGIAICLVMQRMMPKKWLSLINGLGIFIETVAVGLLVSLFIANH